MILIHVPNLSERWSYTLEFIFGVRGIDYQITDSEQTFFQATGTKFSFQNRELGLLLYETSFTKRTISKGLWRELECLSFEGIADPISSIFFVLSRMEEYHNSKWDKHNRFEAQSSLQSKYDWLDTCICDRWAVGIINEIEKEIDETIPIVLPVSKIIPTFDIDNTYAYKLKVGKRKMLSICKDLVFLNFNRLKERSMVLKGKSKDPYDTFQKIKEFASRFQVKLFWLVGDYGGYDKNISISVEQHQKLICDLGEIAEIGIHPSYASNSIPKLLQTEKKKLENTLSKQVKSARQHFLKMKFPQTYQNLLKEGIKEDFTMGFADAVGFRNGTTHAFTWFDLSENKQTDLIVRPFAYMDGTLNEYLKLTPVEAKSKIDLLFNEVKQFGGDFIFLWHNETIGDYGIWKGWSSVLEYTLSLKLNN